MMDEETLLQISEEKRCVCCDKYIAKNLSPTNPACEGAWCEEAIGYWLEEKADE